MMFVIVYAECLPCPKECVVVQMNVSQNSIKAFAPQTPNATALQAGVEAIVASLFKATYVVTTEI